MIFPGQILARHRWIVLVVVSIVVPGILLGANKPTYDWYVEGGPEISWQSIPESTMIIFSWNLRNALLSLIGLAFAVLSGIGLGLSIGVTLWLTSQNPIVLIAFSHGILEIYSALLAMVGGLLIVEKLGKTIWSFFGKPPYATDVNWIEVGKEYGSLFLFSVLGLFVAASLEAFLGYAINHIEHLLLPIACVNTLISVLTVSFLSSSRLRASIVEHGKPSLT